MELPSNVEFDLKKKTCLNLYNSSISLRPIQDDACDTDYDLNISSKCIASFQWHSKRFQRPIPNC